jgi:hypothetical protein
MAAPSLLSFILSLSLSHPLSLFFSDPLDGVVTQLSYEDLVRQHVDGYMASAQQYAQLTDLARRVSEWEEHLVPKLQTEVGQYQFLLYRVMS